MWITPTLIYWSSLGVLTYTYAGYPLAITVLSRIKRRDVNRAPIKPTVTIVMAARNEAHAIERKLNNLLSLDYPSDKLDIIVVSDGSTDGTDELVARFASRKVRLLRQDPACGKASAINLAMPHAQGEIVVFCDVRQRIDANALRALVSAFADDSVGAVSGELELETHKGPGFYWRYEKAIRRAESQFRSVVGATGAWYAIRRHLFQPLPEGLLLDDLYTPMQIVLQGHRVLFEPNAKVFDDEASLKGEFSRKARTLAGNFQLLQKLPGLLDPRRNPIWTEYVSHKVLRLVCPFALVGLYTSNVWLVATGAPGWPFYVGTLTAQTTAYRLALKGAIAPERAGKLARTSYTFVVLNAAALEGCRRFLFGNYGWTSGR